MVDLSTIPYCGIFLAGKSFNIDLDPFPPGWSYAEKFLVRKSVPGEPFKFPSQLFVGVSDSLEKDIAESFSQHPDNYRKRKLAGSWIQLLGHAISNVFLYADAPLSLQLMALQCPSIERLGLQDPSPRIMSEVANLPIFNTLTLCLEKVWPENDCQTIVSYLSMVKVTEIHIICKTGDYQKCGFLSLLLCDVDPRIMERFCFKVTHICCRQILTEPCHKVLPLLTSLNRIRIFKDSDLENLLPILRPPLAVEIHDNDASGVTAGKIGAAVTVFEDSLFALSLNQIRNLRECTGMRRLNVVMRESMDWEFVETLQRMPMLQFLKLSGDDEFDDVHAPIIRSIPSAMWSCVRSCPHLSDIYFNNIEISSAEVDLILRSVGPKLESFMFGIAKQDKHPEEKFVDVMNSAARHCGGSDSKLKYLGIPSAAEMNLVEVAPIPRGRQNIFEEAVNLVTSRCPQLPRICLEEVWNILEEHEVRYMIQAERNMSWASTVVTQISEDSMQD